MWRCTCCKNIFTDSDGYELVEYMRDVYVLCDSCFCKREQYLEDWHERIVAAISAQRGKPWERRKPYRRKLFLHFD